MGFRDLSKLTATALETSRSIPQHLEANVVHFSHNTVNLYLHRVTMKIS